MADEQQHGGLEAALERAGREWAEALAALPEPLPDAEAGPSGGAP